ncbi:MAG: hypothetical protein WA941_11525 [Nitrososphaeraceae archaeon]
MVSAVLVSQQMSGSTVYASEGSPNESGYNHGCDDAGISDLDDR